MHALIESLAESLRIPPLVKSLAAVDRSAVMVPTTGGLPVPADGDEALRKARRPDMIAQMVLDGCSVLRGSAGTRALNRLATARSG
ncbi:hypothetical protein [Nocardia xishanensis]